jgi:hypothetical protein
VIRQKVSSGRLLTALAATHSSVAARTAFGPTMAQEPEAGRDAPADLAALPPVSNDHESGWTGRDEIHFRGSRSIDHLICNTDLSATRASPRRSEALISDQARIVAPFGMTVPDDMVCEINYSDSIIFTLPYGARVDWRRSEGCEIFGYACHEGSAQIRNYITSSRPQHAVTGEVDE